MKMMYAKNLTPNAFIVIEFQSDGPKTIGQFSTEKKGRQLFGFLAIGMISAQSQINPKSGPSGGQTTVWVERNFS